MIIECLLCEYPVALVDDKEYDVVVNLCTGFGAKGGMSVTDDIHNCDKEDWNNED